MKLDKNVIIPLIDISDIKENTYAGIFNDVFAICTDYPSYI